MRSKSSSMRSTASAAVWSPRICRRERLSCAHRYTVTRFVHSTEPQRTELKSTLAAVTIAYSPHGNRSNLASTRHVSPPNTRQLTEPPPERAFGRLQVVENKFRHTQDTATASRRVPKLSPDSCARPALADLRGKPIAESIALVTRADSSWRSMCEAVGRCR
jgi:hypothetical protein